MLQARDGPTSWPLALVAMPFASSKRPSIQLGLLKAIVAAYGFPTTTLHLNLDFAAQIGLVAYEALCRHRGIQIADWLFSHAAFGNETPDPDCRLLNDLKLAMSDLLVGTNEKPDFLRKLRDYEVPCYLDTLMSSIPWTEFRVVGFTSTFQQNVASFALATRIKRKFPHITIVFGGANFEGDMGRELVNSLDCIDYAVIGEGDRTLPEFMLALLEQRDPASVPGVLCRERPSQTTSPVTRAFVDRLDELPIPDYREFFERGDRLGILPRDTRTPVYIPFEGARGCWWGQKHHCTFCGLNGAEMRFRAKSPTRVLGELAELARRHRSFHFEAVDNILDPSYLTDIFSNLSRSSIDYRIFYEVKANLTRQQLKLLCEGGAHRIQPGIESLSTNVLRLMRKGVTALQNINLLRWALYYRIHVSWNLIWGFPHETETDYDNQLDLLRKIAHLPPPISAGRVWMERFSPIFLDRVRFPAISIKPESSYAYVYPKRISLDRVAYFFDYELANTLPDSAYIETAQQIGSWQAAWKAGVRPQLVFWHSPGFITIEDKRDPASPRTTSFQDPASSLYLECSDRPRGPGTLKRDLRLSLTENEVQSVLDHFCVLGFMIQEAGSYLSLALPASAGR
jgi:ribosomal peptide maturation radical SAM protein 1